MKPDTPDMKTNRTPLNVYTILMRATRSITDDMHRHLSEDGLTVSQFGVLEALLHLGPLCQKELSEKVLKTSGNLTLVIDNLVKRGLVRRVQDPADRRRAGIHLTDDGRRLIKTVFKRHENAAETVFAPLTSDEANHFCRMLKKLARIPETSADESVCPV